MLGTEVDGVVTNLSLSGLFICVGCNIDSLGVSVTRVCGVGESIVGRDEASTVVVIKRGGEALAGRRGKRANRCACGDWADWQSAGATDGEAGKRRHHLDRWNAVAQLSVSVVRS